ncbi:NADP-specific glutamate dehydrogenase [Selaginella moellendorffii]|uniref:NADP-specific glutamate dehydrogenase n=1 Tax=Selaginella moellendorffii TaxID=88036 RepID=UPI000D1CD5E6|nr:NADP-specific glutamate dehydrogenase [Selaginella moellendorffii]|eukprot:XP_024527051.1 NADP-specific glutamate dehydrogenase [Selaginella moellendorffii]
MDDIDLELGAEDEHGGFDTQALVQLQQQHEQIERSLHGASSSSALSLQEAAQQEQQDKDHQQGQQQAPRKKKVVKKWRDEWADTYKWAYVALQEGSPRIFCRVCKEFGRKHRRNPYGNEGSRNMQMSALEEHNNSLLHKEALRLQAASRDKGHGMLERPVYIKALLSRTSESIIEGVARRDPNEAEFIQAVHEVVHTLEPVLTKYPQYAHVLERLLEPECIIIFRVPWMDDKGEIHVNRGFRVNFCQALGPYKGGLRFHPSVNLSIIKFLAFDQTLKHSLTPLNLGGARGGSDFDPKGKSDNEVLRFCQSFMEELYRHIKAHQDVFTGDIGVNSREVGYLFGQYRRLTGHFDLSSAGWASRNIRSIATAATGYGLVYFAKFLLADLNKDLRGLRCVVSGSGKVAMHALEKLINFGAVPVTVSDSKSYLLDDDGFDNIKLALIKEIKFQRKSLREYTKRYSKARFYEDAKPWGEKCDLAFPCATQNEINHSDALALVNAGCQVLIEGSDMPCTTEAAEVIRKAGIFIAPSKAANAGGVAITDLEAMQNSSCIQLSAETIDAQLQDFVRTMYLKCLGVANEYGFPRGAPESLVYGANIASFLRVAQALLEQGCV